MAVGLLETLDLTLMAGGREKKLGRELRRMDHPCQREVVFGGFPKWQLYNAKGTTGLSI